MARFLRLTHSKVQEDINDCQQHSALPLARVVARTESTTRYSYNATPGQFPHTHISIVHKELNVFVPRVLHFSAFHFTTAEEPQVKSADYTSLAGASIYRILYYSTTCLCVCLLQQQQKIPSTNKQRQGIQDSLSPSPPPPPPPPIHTVALPFLPFAWVGLRTYPFPQKSFSLTQ